MSSLDKGYSKLDSSQGDRAYLDLEDADLRPEQLSGDQNGEQSIFVSSVGPKKANFFLTAVTIAKTVIGSSILSIPYVVRQMGYVMAVGVFLVAMALNQFGTVLLLKSKNLSRHSNYSTIFYQIHRSKLAKGLGSLLIFLNNIGICIAELIIFKSSIRNILRELISDKGVLEEFYTQAYFIAILVALLEVPPILVSKIEKLRFMALAGVAAIILFMLALVLLFVSASLDSDPAMHPVGNMRMFPQNWLLAASAVPNVLLALSYQMNFFPIFKGMTKASDSRMVWTVTAGLVFCLFSYILVGVLGYAYVGEGLSANFLQSVSYSKVPLPIFALVNASFLASLFFAFPIMFFGGRNNFIALVKLVFLTQEHPRQPKDTKADDQIEVIGSYLSAEQSPADRRRKAKGLFVGYTLLIYLLTVGVAIGVDDVEVVFNSIGAVCSTSIAILLPCYFYCRLVVLRGQPKTVRFYLSIVVFAVMAPYAIFSVIALHVASE